MQRSAFCLETLPHWVDAGTCASTLGSNSGTEALAKSVPAVSAAFCCSGLGWAAQRWAGLWWVGLGSASSGQAVLGWAKLCCTVQHNGYKELLPTGLRQSSCSSRRTKIKAKIIWV